MEISRSRFPREMIIAGRNRSELQAIIQFSATVKSIGLSISFPSITFSISARQIWSASPDRPLTICTRYTPLNAKVPGQILSGGRLDWNIASLDDEGSWNTLRCMPMTIKDNIRAPRAKDWQQEASFVTIPALNSGHTYNVDRKLNLSTVPINRRPRLVCGETVYFKLVRGYYFPILDISWWNWGDLEGDLKSKKLGHRKDPKSRGRNREEEKKRLPDELVLGYDNWRDTEDDQGNRMVRLEVEFDETPMRVQVDF
ncbi:hypothetical protein GQ44DRAFT_822694 [Phaeosphaeriaceae sp. PMI808]|nr:hypothetical protein GQ44DRAFT_822694 [Phaeosphaeriaceae sp. PMI808]